LYCKVIASDFSRRAIVSFSFGRVILSWHKHKLNLKGQVERVEIVTEENKKNILSAAGWGLAGSVLAGPLGLVPGLIFGGRTKEINFVCFLKDGRKFLAVGDIKAYQKIYSCAFIEGKSIKRNKKS